MEWLHIIQVPTDFGGNPDLDPDQGIF